MGSAASSFPYGGGIPSFSGISTPMGGGASIGKFPSFGGGLSNFGGGMSGFGGGQFSGFNGGLSGFGGGQFSGFNGGLSGFDSNPIYGSGGGSNFGGGFGGRVIYVCI
jgi:hypothetical protein